MRTCVRCGRQLGTDAASCAACGRPAEPHPAGMADLTRPIRPSQLLPAGRDLVRPSAKDILSGPVDLTQPARPQRTQAQPPAEFWADPPPVAVPAPTLPPAGPASMASPANAPSIASPSAAGPASPLLPASPSGTLPPAPFRHLASQPAAAPSAAVPAESAPKQNGWQSLSVARPAHGRWLVFTVAAVVVLLAGGGTALALAKLSHHNAPGRPDAAAGHGPAGQHRTPDSAPDSPSASAQPVALAPGVATQPQATDIRRLLDRYFTAINRHRFVAFRHLLTPDARHGMTLAHFAAGYGTTTDSLVVLRNTATTSTGQVAAHVTFTSHQDAANSPTHSTCTNWDVEFYLVRDGSGFLVGLPPAGYTATYTACS